MVFISLSLRNKRREGASLHDDTSVADLNFGKVTRARHYTSIHDHHVIIRKSSLCKLSWNREHKKLYFNLIDRIG